MIDYSPPAGALGSYSRYNEKHSSAKSRQFSHVLFIRQKKKKKLRDRFIKGERSHVICIS